MLGSRAIEEARENVRRAPGDIRALARNIKTANFKNVKAGLSRLDQYSPLRAVILDPQMIRKAVKAKKAERHTAVAECFSLILDLIAIQRSQGSSLFTSDGQPVLLRHKFKNVICRTISLEMHLTEKPEYQAHHRMFAE